MQSRRKQSMCQCRCLPHLLLPPHPCTGWQPQATSFLPHALHPLLLHMPPLALGGLQDLAISRAKQEPQYMCRPDPSGSHFAQSRIHLTTRKQPRRNSQSTQSGICSATHTACVVSANPALNLKALWAPREATFQCKCAHLLGAQACQFWRGGP